MDYKEEYEAMVKRCRELHEYGNALTKQQMVIVCPQLKESEDERARKWLYDFVHNCPNETFEFYGGVGKKAVLAYLEKQKENIEKEYVFRPLAGTDINSAALQAIRKADEGDRLVLAFNGAYIPVRKGCNANKIVDIYDAFIEKQKEPHYTMRNALFDKCVENCDPEVMKKVSDEVDEILEKEKQKEQKPESCDCSRDEESYTNGIHHVLMNPEAYGLIKQKPAEQLGGTFTSYDMAKTFTEGQNYVIAHPEKFGLCKPAEWSEEDDALLKEIVSFFKDGTVKLQHDLDLYAGFLENKFKSLQPHWKPSKEQMEAVEEALEFYSGITATAKGLRSLYNDLKKL